MDEELKEELYFEINMLTKFGFYDNEEINEIIEDMFFDEELDEDFIEKEIEKAIDLKSQEEKNWDEITDCDRLDEAFKELNSYSFITLHNAGYTIQDSAKDAIEVHRYLTDKEEMVYGFCFYNTMDIENAINDNYLEIGYGEFIGEELKTAKIAEDIVFILEKHGLKTEWSYSIKDRIKIKPIKWQKRFDGKGYGMERAFSDFIEFKDPIMNEK